MTRGGTKRTIYGYDQHDVVLTPQKLRATVTKLVHFDGMMRADIRYTEHAGETAWIPAHLLTRWRGAR